jgi:tripartite-type tricarboxylate transporter receptor subunit TctC
MTNKTGQPVRLGSSMVMTKADGYTLLFSRANPTLYMILGISDLSIEDLTPISLMANVPGVIIVSKDSPYNSLQELLDYAKTIPGKVTMVSPVWAVCLMSAVRS